VGNSNIFFESDNTISEYLRTLPYFLEYRCNNGAVRIYLPNADYRRTTDSFRHRFYTPASIKEETAGEVVKIISESLVRRSVFANLMSIQSIDDIERLIIEQSLKEAIASKRDDKIIDVYQQQVQNLKTLLNEKEFELSQYCRLYDDKDAEAENLRGEIKVIAEQNFSLRTQNKQLAEASAGNDVLSLPEKVPTCLVELLDWIESGFPKKVVVLEEAKRSADGFEVRDINRAYKLLRSIPDVLHDLMFSGDGDKRAQYANSTGFELSMTESKMTKRDGSLAKLRRRRFNGQDIDINAHVGFGNRHPNLLRVHFYIAQSEGVIVIGHCGDHLDNFSTRSMS
jgi:hypothetical protein